MLVNELEPRGAWKRACEATDSIGFLGSHESQPPGRLCYVFRVKAATFLPRPRLLSLSQAEGTRSLRRTYSVFLICGSNRSRLPNNLCLNNRTNAIFNIFCDSL